MKSKSAPDFLVIGAMKSGTSSLYSDLCMHPGIFMPANKEPWILTEDSGAEEHQQEYKRLFSSAPDGALAGEATTGYAFSPLFGGVPERAKAVCGSELKIIYILRDPVERAVSHLKHDVNSGRITVSNAEEIARTDTRYLDVSNYSMQLGKWTQHFKEQNIHLVSFERYVSGRNEELAKLFDFLGLAPLPVVGGFEVKNRSSNAKSLSGPFRLFFQSRLYRKKVHQFIPERFRAFGKKALLRRSAPGVAFTPSVETRRWFAESLDESGWDSNPSVVQIFNS